MEGAGPAVPECVFAESFRHLKGTRRMKGGGNQIEISMMLKKCWSRAICIAFFFSVTIEARKAGKWSRYSPRA